MAKKKANNIVISDEELVPTTLGTYSNKGRSPLIVFFILAIFLLIAFYMPNIQKSINKFLGKESNTQNNNNTPNVPGIPDTPDTPDNPEVEDVKYDISTDTVIDGEKFKIDNIGFTYGELSLSVSSKTSVDLNPYFIELYNSDNMFLGRVKLSDDNLTAEDSVTYNYNIPSDSTKMSIVKKTLDDYPEVALSYNDKNEGIMTCKNTLGEEYIYTFVSDQLSKVVYSFKLSSSDENYMVTYNNYSELDNKYKSIDNVSSSLINSDNGFDYTLSLNLDSISSDDIKQIMFDGIYKIKTQAKEVKFVSEAKNYTCSV